MNRIRPILEGLSEAQRVELLARLEQFVDRSGGPAACHPFTGGSRQRGYGVLWTRQPDGRRRLVKAHRLAFEAVTGESPETVDHRCHDARECRGLGENCPHRLCCNPAHLAPETIGDNVRRNQLMVYLDRCGRGHAMTPENVHESEKGERSCRKCAAENARDARTEARAERPQRERKQKYRPRGMSLPELVEWGLADNVGDGCWAWREALIDGEGYIQITIGQRKHLVHRLVHEVLIGPIPAGFVVDHECHDPAECTGGRNCPHRQCVNPAHLVAVSNGDNSAAERSSRVRKTHCPKDHEYTPENTRVDKRGGRHCRECDRQSLRDSRAKAREGVVDGRYRVDGKCGNGHVIAEVGVTSNGKCAQCRRDTNARYKARQRQEN